MNFTTQEIIGIALMSLSFIAIPILEAYLARLEARDTEEHLTRAILNATAQRSFADADCCANSSEVGHD